MGKDGADGKDKRNLFLMYFVCFILVWGLACVVGFSWAGWFVVLFCSMLRRKRTRSSQVILRTERKF